MAGTFVILDLLGGVALLLWGVRMVRTGMERGWGDRLRAWLERRLSNRIAAFGGGFAVTAVLGSSTATTLIVASLAGTGVLAPAAGLAVLLGADVGSAATAAVLASGSSAASMLAPVLIFAGLAMGFGARTAGGCTSGHGMSGMSLGSPASIVASMTFFATAVALSPGTFSRPSFDPCVVRIPAVAKMSFAAKGTPSTGLAGFPAR